MTALGTFVGVIGLVVSVIQIGQSFSTPPQDLEMALLAVDRSDEIKGSSFSVTGYGGSTPSTVGATPIDVTLKNNGGEPALISRVEAEVVYFKALADCTRAGGGEGRVSALYSVQIPMRENSWPAEPAETNISYDTRFEVKPGSVDRMIITVGPKVQSLSSIDPMVMAVKLKLIHDDEQVLEVGTVSVVTTNEDAEFTIERMGALDGVQECAQENLAALDELFAIQATRSTVLDRLRNTYQQFV